MADEFPLLTFYPEYRQSVVSIQRHFIESDPIRAQIPFLMWLINFWLINLPYPAIARILDSLDWRSITIFRMCQLPEKGQHFPPLTRTRWQQILRNAITDHGDSIPAAYADVDHVMQLRPISCHLREMQVLYFHPTLIFPEWTSMQGLAPPADYARVLPISRITINPRYLTAAAMCQNNSRACVFNFPIDINDELAPPQVWLLNIYDRHPYGIRHYVSQGCRSITWSPNGRNLVFILKSVFRPSGVCRIYTEIVTFFYDPYYKTVACSGYYYEEFNPIMSPIPTWHGNNTFFHAGDINYPNRIGWRINYSTQPSIRNIVINKSMRSYWIYHMALRKQHIHYSSFNILLLNKPMFQFLRTPGPERDYIALIYYYGCPQSLDCHCNKIVVLNLTKRLCYGVIHFLGLIDYAVIGTSRLYFFYEQIIYRRDDEPLNTIEPHHEQALQYLPLRSLETCAHSVGYWTQYAHRIQYVAVRYHFLRFQLQDIFVQYNDAGIIISCNMERSIFFNRDQYPFATRNNSAFRDDHTFIYTVDKRLLIFQILPYRTWDGLRLSEQPQRDIENYSFATLSLDHHTCFHHTRSLNDDTHIMTFYHPQGHFRIDFTHLGILLINTHYSSPCALDRMFIA